MLQNPLWLSYPPSLTMNACFCTETGYWKLNVVEFIFRLVFFFCSVLAPFMLRWSVVLLSMDFFCEISIESFTWKGSFLIWRSCGLSPLLQDD